MNNGRKGRYTAARLHNNGSSIPPGKVAPGSVQVLYDGDGAPEVPPKVREVNHPLSTFFQQVDKIILIHDMWARRHNTMQKRDVRSDAAVA